MKRTLFTAALAVIVLASSLQAVSAQTSGARPVAAVQAAPAAQPMMPENPTVTRRAMEWFNRFQSSDIDRAQLDSDIDAKLTPAVIAGMKRQLAPLGPATGIGYGGARMVKGNYVYRYVVVFSVGAIQEFMSVDKQGKIAGVLFLPMH